MSVKAADHGCHYYLEQTYSSFLDVKQTSTTVQTQYITFDITRFLSIYHVQSSHAPKGPPPSIAV